MRLLTTAAAAILTTCAIGSLVASSAGSSSPITHTEVTLFQPSVPATRAKERGRCWTESIAVSRPGVWRCMQGNMIYDPCFEVQGHHDRVVCGANPVKANKGFLLMLNQPVKQQPNKEVPQPWLIELADGSVCESATGTMAVINDEPVRYPCGGSALTLPERSRIYCGLLSKLHPGKVWRADKVCYTVSPSKSGPPFKLQNRESVTIRRIWE